MTSTTDIQSTFEKEVLEGLLKFPKAISSKYFYDEVGDVLFQKIMDLQEYYLTRTEHQIFIDQKHQIIEAIDPEEQGFDLIELGAGDGLKTKVLLNHILETNRPIVYKPIDISSHALQMLQDSLKTEIPSLDVQPHQGEYFEVLRKIDKRSDRKKVILFLGSNLGNLNHELAIQFLSGLRACMNPQDILLMGLDLKKDPAIIKKAYDDSEGVTAAFNMNLLDRINKALDANFDTSKFIHQPHYNPETGTAKSFIVSTEKQRVYLSKLDQHIEFAPWESIHTEISQKYDERLVQWLSEESGLEIVTRFTDEKVWFGNYLLKLKA